MTLVATKTARCLEYVLRDMTPAEAERLATVSQSFAEMIRILLWRRVPNEALRQALQRIEPSVSVFDVARDIRFVPQWLVSDGAIVILYDRERRHIRDVIGADDGTSGAAASDVSPSVLSFLVDDPSAPGEDLGDEATLQRQVEDAVGSKRAVTVLAVDHQVGVRLLWHRAASS